MRIPKQFSFRIFFVASIVVGIMLAAWIGRSQKQQAVAEAITNYGGWLIYSKPYLPIPSYMVNSVGHDYFCSIDSISLFPTDTLDADQQIKVLKDVPHLRELGIWPGARTCPISPDSKSRKSINHPYAELGSQPAASSYGINERDFPGGLSEAGLDYLLETLPNLQFLALFSAKIPQDSESLNVAKKRITTIQCWTHSAFDQRKRLLR